MRGSAGSRDVALCMNCLRGRQKTGEGGKRGLYDEQRWKAWLNGRECELLRGGLGNTNCDHDQHSWDGKGRGQQRHVKE